MADVHVRFQCGCTAMVDVDRVTSPTCATHGRRAAGVVKAPAPTFRGVVSGPHAVTVRLDPIAVPLAKAPLALKETVDAQ